MLGQLGKEPLTLVGIHRARRWRVGSFGGGKFRFCGFGGHGRGLDKMGIGDYYTTITPTVILKISISFLYLAYDLFIPYAIIKYYLG